MTPDEIFSAAVASASRAVAAQLTPAEREAVDGNAAACGLDPVADFRGVVGRSARACWDTVLSRLSERLEVGIAAEAAANGYAEAQALDNAAQAARVAAARVAPPAPVVQHPGYQWQAGRSWEENKEAERGED